MGDEHARSKGTLQASTLQAVSCPTLCASQDQVQRSAIESSSTVKGSDPPPSERMAVGSHVGRFVVLDVLGEGATGVVYLAYDRELDRKIALKLVRQRLMRTEEAHATRTRLMREAQALARLNHPNVVTVFDIGTFGDRVFIAQAYVDGLTLDKWLATRSPSLREIIKVFVQAGQGLGAAHRAGLVHRDFKPPNVLVGADGRVHVTDFGLARAIGEVQGDGEVSADQLCNVSTALSTPLTMAGAIQGTPAYMAPEQHLGGKVDARSDQFNFCVALYESLYGELPFEGRTLGQLAYAASQGRVRPPAKDSRVPAWLRKAILRGMDPNPENRYPCMEALIQALNRDPIRLHKRIAAGVGVLCVIAAIVAIVTWQNRRALRVCQGADRKLEGLWDADRKSEIRSAMLATKVPYAQASWKTVERAVDVYTRAWVSMHEDACIATRIRGEESEAVLDLKMACLSRRLAEAKALTDILGAADDKIVERAAQAAGSLPNLSVCADTSTLRDVLPPPKAPETIARMRDIRKDVASAKALEDAGKYKEGTELIESVLVQTKPLDYAPLLAEVLLQAGALKHKMGDAKGAEDYLKESLWSAIAGKHREIEARSAIKLASIVGYYQKRTDIGLHWARHAQAALTSLGPDDVLRSEWHDSMASLYAYQGDFDKQLEHNQQALNLRMRAFGPEHILVLISLNNLAVGYVSKGDGQNGVNALQRALSVWDNVVGPTHPRAGISRFNLADALALVGDFEQEREQAERGLGVMHAAFGQQHFYVAEALLCLGLAFINLEKYEDAIKTLRSAQAMFETTESKDDPDVARAQTLVALALSSMGSHDHEAQEVSQRAIDIIEAASGPTHILLADPLTIRAKSRLILGAPDEAWSSAKRAMDLRDRSGGPADTIARTRFVAAQALWLLGTDPVQALGLAEQAREQLRPLGFRKREVSAIDAWLGAKRTAAH